MTTKDNLLKLENLADDLLYYWGLVPLDQQQKIREEHLQFVKTIEDIRDYLENESNQ